MIRETCEIYTELELIVKKLEVIFHPAWKGFICQEMAEALLENMPVMTYLLRQGVEGEYDYWLSHKKSNGTVHHRHFSIRQSINGLCFENFNAPASTSLDSFICGALNCRD